MLNKKSLLQVVSLRKSNVMNISLLRVGSPKDLFFVNKKSLVQTGFLKEADDGINKSLLWVGFLKDVMFCLCLLFIRRVYSIRFWLFQKGSYSIT